MIEFFTITCIACAFVFLFLLARIDLKTRLLPNKYVLRFAICACIFHSLTKFHYTSPLFMLFGLAAGGGLLLLIRAIANRAYKKDTLGLGDVKLLGAAGLWLGLDDIFLAIAIGAFAGMLHGISMGISQQRKTGEKLNLSTLSVPAGPGFIAGIIIVGIIKFYTLPQFLGLL